MTFVYGPRKHAVDLISVAPVVSSTFATFMGNDGTFFSETLDLGQYIRQSGANVDVVVSH